VRVAADAAAARHVAVHVGHCVELNEHAAACIDMTAAKQLSFTDRLQEAYASGSLKSRLTPIA